MLGRLIASVALVACLAAGCTSGTPAASSSASQATVPAAAQPTVSSPAAPVSAPPGSPQSSPSAAVQPSPSALPTSSYRPTPLQPRASMTIGVLGITADAPVYIAKDKGYFDQEGIDVQLTSIQSLADSVAPLARGDLDVAEGGTNAGLFNAMSRGVTIRIVADGGSVPVAANDSGGLMVRKALIDSGKVKDYADLKGLRVAQVGKDNNAEIWIVRGLQQGGLSLKDVEYTPGISFPNLGPAFANSAIDAAIVGEPFVTLFTQQGTAVFWRGLRDLYGADVQASVVLYGGRMLQNQDLGRHYMTAFLRGVRDYDDAFFSASAVGRDQAIDIAARESNVKDAALWNRIKLLYLDPAGTLNLTSMQQDVAYYQTSGALTAPVDVTSGLDLSYIQYAVQQLGPYQAR